MNTRFGRLLAALALALVLVLPAAAATGYTQTRYPIVLVHGLFGFAKLGAVDYFYQIPAGLTSGGAKVYAATVSASNYTEVRGEQLIAELDTLRALHGHARFNLIGHSHGGPTARYVAAVRPDLVASVTSVAAPHAGSATADGIATITSGPLQPVVINVLNLFASVLGTITGSDLPQDSYGALVSLSTPGAAVFNATYPQGAPSTACGQGPELVNGIRYFSLSGTSVLTNLFDPTDAVLSAGSIFFGGEANDGLVGRCSSHWGTVLRDDYGWNHFDEVNQTLSLRGLFSSNPVTVYRAQANRLKNLGL